MYTIKRGDTLSSIAGRHGVTLNALLSANPRYKSDPNAINVGDQLAIPGKDTFAAEKATKKKPAKKKASKRTSRAAPATADDEDDFSVSSGQLTFDAEGLEKPGRFFSRRLHVPGPWSGATIGRGYDMRERSKDEIVADLAAAGVAKAKA
jgi:murein DD-endopeptidase MepM/ murein hydrolase activator NlpD